LHADKTLLTQQLFAGTPINELLTVTCGQGDPHDGGRSVAILELNTGKLVYKPKDSRPAREIHNLLTSLSKAFETCNIRCPITICRGKYAWEEYIAQKPCTNENEPAIFYNKLGQWLCLLQLLGANDFWFDNLIASGCEPVFIDFETILQPSFKEKSATTQLPLSIDFNNTPADVGILPYFIPVANLTAIDIGCLTRPGYHNNPLFETGFVKSQEQIKLVEPTWYDDKYAPNYRGEFIDITQHFTSFLTGYSNLYCKLATKEGVGLIKNFIKRMADIPLRFIRLDTWSGYRFINISLLPAALVDGVQREIYLNRVWRVFGLDNSVDLVSSCIVDLRRLDIPLFYTYANRLLLYSKNKLSLDNYFSHSAKQLVIRRLDNLNYEQLQTQLKMVETIFSTRQDQPSKPLPMSKQLSLNSLPKWLDIARTIADKLLNLLVYSEDGLPFWAGRSFSKLTNSYYFGFLPSDIRSGDCGIALCLAKLYSITGERKYKNLVKEIIQKIGFLINPNQEKFTNLNKEHYLGDWLYTTVVCSKLCKIKVPNDIINNLIEAAKKLAFSKKELVTYLMLLNTIPKLMGSRNVFKVIGDGLVVELNKLTREEIENENSTFDTNNIMGQWANARKYWPNLKQLEASANLNSSSYSSSVEPREAISKQFVETHDGMVSVSTKKLINKFWDVLVNSDLKGEQPRQISSEIIAKIIYKRYVSFGSWFPDDYASDDHNLSIFDGLSLMLLIFISLHDDTFVNKRADFYGTFQYIHFGSAGS
jgi:type 2 lantibiotic biosynthesis protein LanM